MWLTAQLPELPDGILVEIGSLVDLPEDHDAWVVGALAHPLPADATLKRTATDMLFHSAGWPITTLTVEVSDAAGRVLETRVVWMFELVVRGALVRARIAPAARPAWDAALHARVLAALCEAPIRLHGSEPVAIAELYEP